MKSGKRTEATVGHYLLRRLQQHGVKHIFGVPGDYVLRLDQLIEQDLTFVNSTREDTAGYMADAYARLKGLGVACITYGVGVNISVALAQAYVESSPVVVISGAASKKEHQRSRHLHHLINSSFSDHRDTTQLEIFKQMTVAQAILDDASEAVEEIDRVLEICTSRSKPVYIEIPRDLVDAAVKLPLESSEQVNLDPNKSDLGVLQEAFSEIESILKRSQNPVLWVGHEIQRFGLATDVETFAEKYHIPIVSSLLGKTVVSENHPLFVGVYLGESSRPEVREYVEQCDCVIILGTILSDMDTGIFTDKVEQSKRIIATTEKIQISRHHYDSIHFADFVKRLAEYPLNVCYRNQYPASIDRPPVAFVQNKNKKITPDGVFECLQRHLKAEHLLVADIGDSLFGSADLVLEQNSFLAGSYFASMGFAIPGVIGAQIASPKRRVVGILGDGSFQMNCMELSTAVRFHLDPVIIVLNNHGYGTERLLLEGKFNDILNWNYTEITKILGSGTAFKVHSEGDFEKALSEAFSHRGTFFLIEVELSKTEYSSAMKRFINAVKGKK